MELTEKNFQDCEEIVLDLSYAQPRVSMYGALGNQKLIKSIKFNDKAGARNTYAALYKKWMEVKHGTS